MQDTKKINSFNELIGILIDFRLICLSTEQDVRCQTRPMMSQQSCAQKAAMCEGRAAECGDAGHQVHWLEMAAVWRELAGDTNAQATLARMMHLNRIASRSDPVQISDNVG